MTGYKGKVLVLSSFGRLSRNYGRTLGVCWWDDEEMTVSVQDSKGYLSYRTTVAVKDPEEDHG